MGSMAKRETTTACPADFTDEFKAGAVRLVIDEGKSVGQVARELDLTASALRRWVERARADRGTGKPGVLTTAEREELGGCGRRIAAPDGARHLKKSGGLLREGEPVKFAFIAAKKAELRVTHPRAGVCGCHAQRILCVAPPAGIDARANGSATARGGPRLVRREPPAVRQSAGPCGSGGPGRHVSRKRVARVMQEEGLKARPRKRFKRTTKSDHDQPVAANLLDRDFTAEAPNERWVGDTTEFLVGESGKLYLAAILDLFSRFVVGWAMSAVNDRHLTMKALAMAIARRCPEAGLVAPFGSRLHVRKRGLPDASSSARHHLQHEPPRRLLRQRRHGELLLDGEERSWASTLRATGRRRRQLFDYIEVFYNQRRRHSTLGQISPAAFERRTAAA